MGDFFIEKDVDSAQMVCYIDFVTTITMKQLIEDFKIVSAVCYNPRRVKSVILQFTDYFELVYNNGVRPLFTSLKDLVESIICIIFGILLIPAIVIATLWRLSGKIVFTTLFGDNKPAIREFYEQEKAKKSFDNSAI